MRGRCARLPGARADGSATRRSPAGDPHTSSPPHTLDVSYTYDATGNVLTVSDLSPVTPDGDVAFDFAYTYDA